MLLVLGSNPGYLREVTASIEPAQLDLASFQRNWIKTVPRKIHPIRFVADGRLFACQNGVQRWKFPGHL